MEVRRRVLEAISDLGYRPNPLARQLAKGVSESMGFVMHPLVPIETYFGDILLGAEEEARLNGYHLYFSRVYHTMGVLSGQSSQRGGLEESIGGIIYAGELSQDFLEQLRRLAKPLVIVNSSVGEVEHVMCDNFESSYKAVSYLITLGHRRIACIGCDAEDVSSIEERVVGYRQALRDAGIPLDERFYERSSTTIEGGYRVVKRLMSYSDRPTAIFGTTDEMAVGAMSGAKEMGFRVPEDLSVIGVNDLEIAEMCDPPLTTIRIHRKEMGRVAVRRLLEVMKNPEKRPTRTNVLCEFIERRSCARASG
jgi:LacI family transcriptional regulator